MALPAKTYYTAQQYLELEREAQYKSEYINGEIYQMSGASREHNLIALNVGTELNLQLRTRQCEVYVADMRVKVRPTGMYTYPDAVVACGEPLFEDEHVDSLLNPTVIIEVLSPSTESYDRGEKFAHYREIGSLKDYVLVSQDKARVEHYARQPGDEGAWLFTAADGLDATLQLRSIGCELALRDIYAKVQFPEPEGPLSSPTSTGEQNLPAQNGGQQ